MERLSNFSLKDKKTLGLTTLGVLGLVYLADYLSERGRQTPIWVYKTDPPHYFNWDRYVRVLTNPLMKLAAEGIISHHWDWIPIPNRDEYSQRWFYPNQDKFYTRYEDPSILHHVLAHSALGVQEVCILGLDTEQIANQGLKVMGYHYTFQVEGQERLSKSRIVIPPHEQVRLLISTKPLRVLALDGQNNELPSIVEGPFYRKNKEVLGFRQL